MITINQVEIKRVLGEIRPNMLYEERMSGTFLKQNEVLTEVIIWDVSNPQAIPTEQEFITEQESLNAADAQLAQEQAGAKAEIDDYGLDTTRVLLALELVGDVTKAYVKGQNPDIDTVYLAFFTRLAGSVLQTPIINYVTMMTGITDFAVTTSQANKRSIMSNAIDFLQNIELVWVGRDLLN